MKNILITYSIILALGISSMVTGIHYLANIAGFISAVGFMVVFFKDQPADLTEEEAQHAAKMRRYWYIVFGTGILFSLLFGSFWNSEMGNMV